MDRDINAAINIRDFAIHKSNVNQFKNTEGTSGIQACGEVNSYSEKENESTLQKQENFI